MPAIETEVWYRNFFKCMQQLVQCNIRNFLTTKQELDNKNTDLVKYMKIHLGESTIDWRCMVVQYYGNCVQEVRTGFTVDKPYAVYQLWKYGQPLEILEEMCYNDPGRDPDHYNNEDILRKFRPSPGQEHRIFLADIPHSDRSEGLRIISILSELQAEHPQVTFHVMNTMSYRVHFGLNFKTALIDPWAKAAGKEVLLPTGKVINAEKLLANPYWPAQIGYDPKDLVESRAERMKFNIESAKWASKYYKTQIKFQSGTGFQQRSKTQARVTETLYQSDVEYNPAQGKRILSGNMTPVQVSDRFHCDTCSLQLQCTFFRKGAVCSVPDAEPASLSQFFGTRDSEKILDGLALLMAANARRLEEGLHSESIAGEIDKQVSDLMKTLFDHGVKLAKLVNPSLRGSAVQVNVAASGDAQVNIGNPRKMISAAIRELEVRGFTREQITPQLIQGLIEGMNNPDNQRKAIEGTVMHKKDS